MKLQISKEHKMWLSVPDDLSTLNCSDLPQRIELSTFSTTPYTYLSPTPLYLSKVMSSLKQSFKDDFV